MSGNIKTVLGNVDESEIICCLSHEHICCYSEYIDKMVGRNYLDKEILTEKSIAELKRLKNEYGLNLFVDCTPVNIGRDVELLKKVSEESGVHIVCSTGFYWTDESVLHNSTEELLAEYMMIDSEKVNAGILKAAVENEKLSDFNVKLLKATAIAHKNTGLPIVLHTNAHNKNGLIALEILIECGVKPGAVTVSHLSDTEDIQYVLKIAKYGSFVGLDRMYGDKSEEYINNKLRMISQLIDYGFENKIILSHDELFFNGFEREPKIKEKTRFDYVFKCILPNLNKKTINKVIRENPICMLKMENINNEVEK